MGLRCLRNPLSGDFDAFLSGFGGFTLQFWGQKWPKWAQFRPKTAFQSCPLQQVNAGKVHFWSQKCALPVCVSTILFYCQGGWVVFQRTCPYSIASGGQSAIVRGMGAVLPIQLPRLYMMIGVHPLSGKRHPLTTLDW